MQPNEAPGLNEMNPSFYQAFWGTVGEKVTKDCLEYLNKEEFLQEINATNLVLIPKNNRPQFVAHLRSIPLCNVLYKIISKVLANILKTILPNMISKNQSTFFPRRMIIDNIMIAFEVYHYIRRK